MSEDVRLRRKRNASSTQVANAFIDRYMTEANGEYVKVYLYLLRCISADLDNLTISDIADHFDDTEKDVKRALKYWEKMNLLHLEYDGKVLTSIEVADIPEEPEESNIITLTRSSAKKTAPKKPPAEPARVISDEDREQMRELLFVTETYLGKTLSPTDTEKIIYFRDELKFSFELIEYLVEYCVSSNYKSMKTIEKVALSWHEAGITTPEAARMYIVSHSNAYRAVTGAFGITGRALNKEELKFLNRWTREFGFGEEIIREACNRTIEFTHQASFKYADCILDKWYKADVTSMEDIQRLDAEHKSAGGVAAAKPKYNKVTVTPNKFNNFKQRDYDYEALEKQLLGNTGN